MLPKHSTLNSFAIRAPPPLENRFVHSEQFGHTNPDIFSITPKMGIFTLRQNDNSFLTSAKATA